MFEFVVTTSNVSLPYSCLKTHIESCLVHSTELETVGNITTNQHKATWKMYENLHVEHYIVYVTFPPRLIRSFRYALYPTNWHIKLLMCTEKSDFSGSTSRWHQNSWTQGKKTYLITSGFISGSHFSKAKGNTLSLIMFRESAKILCKWSLHTTIYISQMENNPIPKRCSAS